MTEHVFDVRPNRYDDVERDSRTIRAVLATVREDPAIAIFTGKSPRIILTPGAAFTLANQIADQLEAIRNRK
ncbi:hypothetical protein [Sinomonas gamaensis]|uniref:hypothetical protein n=1 Tax=Sinomonas gamaensis TaxID=2565624 RepID=UPI001108B41A|nr:hypothetical protein [Sinomonas gamaensis]